MSNLGPYEEKPLDSSVFGTSNTSNQIRRTCEGGKVGRDEPVTPVEAAQVGRDGDQRGADDGDLGRREENANA